MIWNENLERLDPVMSSNSLDALDPLTLPMIHLTGLSDSHHMRDNVPDDDNS